MKSKSLIVAMACALPALVSNRVLAQADAPPIASIPAVTQQEKDAMYNAVLEERVAGIMQELKLTQPAVSNQVHGILIDHYHALRSRDEAMDAELNYLQKGSDEWLARRDAMFPSMSKPLHDEFIARLEKVLTPPQVETVKDKMTYGKVEFTYNAYCSIVPNLTADDKARILDLLKQAREAAIDGGTSGEKSAIFQRYKNRINAYLATQGIDVEKALKEWTEKHPGTNTFAGK